MTTDNRLTIDNAVCSVTITPDQLRHALCNLTADQITALVEGLGPCQIAIDLASALHRCRRYFGGATISPADAGFDDEDETPEPDYTADALQRQREHLAQFVNAPAEDDEDAPLRWIAVSRLTDAERDAICYAINSRGDGQHPVAQRDNLKHFTRGYAVECCDREIVASFANAPTAAGRILLETCIDKLMDSD